jgi:hypothetical protein
MISGVKAAGLAAFAAVMLCASSASASSVTLGPSEIPSTFPLSAFSCRIGCEVPFTVAQRSSANTDVAPAAGVITSWRVNGVEGPLALRVLEPTSGGGFVGAGSAPATDLLGQPMPTELAIGRGGLIGVDVGEGGALGAQSVARKSAEILFWQPVLGEGESRTNDNTNEEDVMLVNAQLELAPVVTSVSPATGSTAGGQTVTITGKYLDSALNVVFGSRPATTFSVDLSGEHITATTPASSVGTVDVQVSNLRSTSETVAADKYTFVAPPASPGGSAPPPGGGGSGPGGTPVVTGFKQSSARWRLGSALPHISSAPVGTTFAFTLSASANVSLTFMRALPGRRAGGSCVAPSHRNSTKPRCKRYVPAGSVAVPGHAGLAKVAFQGRLSRTKKLTPGNYTATVTARDSHGSKALARSLSFTILS